MMRILILEDEPIIAIDLEDILTTSQAGLECVLATTVVAGLRSLDEGTDFAILDIHLGHGREACWLLAARLKREGIPFCFVSCSRRALPAKFQDVPFVAKPFQPREITRMLPLAA